MERRRHGLLRGGMQATKLSTTNEPLLCSLGEIYVRGWLSIKTRSMINMKPRHTRYCILCKDTKVLSIFKFQPSHSELISTNNTLKPLRSYTVLGVAPWNGSWGSRSNGFLLSVVTDDHNMVERVLEVDSSEANITNEWLTALRELTKDDVDEELKVTEKSTSPSKNPHKEEKNIWIKGASVHRGLSNASGENNCFLNVIIQSFWHLTSMKQFLMHVEIREDTKTVEANVLRALKSIMLEYDDTSNGMLIHSRALRKGLSVLYQADKNFQEGAMYDAEETLLALLDLMHQQTDVTDINETQKQKENMRRIVRLISEDEPLEELLLNSQIPPPAPNETVQDIEHTDVGRPRRASNTVYDNNSIPHLVFSHQLYDRKVCDTCQHTTPWELSSNLIFTTYASELSRSPPTESMDELIRSLTWLEPETTCGLNECTGKNVMQRTIHHFPMVFCISILWATNSASKDNVAALLANIRDRIDLAHCFEASGPAIRYKNGGTRTTYHLRGFVCYYGRHYIALFYSTAHKSWLLFDDSRVLEIGSWEQVVDECLKGRFQPVLLFYELPERRKDSSVGLQMMVGSPPASGQFIKSHISPSSTDTLSRRIASLSIDEVIDENIDEHDTTNSSTDTDTQPLASTTQDSQISDIDPQKSKMVVLQGHKELELSELKHFTGQSPSQQSSQRTTFHSQNIDPVAEAIAMAPRNAAMNAICADDEYDVKFSDDSVILGLKLQKIDKDLCVVGFPRSSNGEMFACEKSGMIYLFDQILQANGHPLHHYQPERAVKMIKSMTRPLILRFSRSIRLKKLVQMGIPEAEALTALIDCMGDVAAAANYCFNK